MRRMVKGVAGAVGALAVIGGAGVAFLALRPPSQRPAPTETIERTPERAARGKYLVEHVCDCGGCHSDHEWDKFATPVKAGTLLAGGYPFTERDGVPGVVCAQNLTPDPDTGKGRWTDGELLRALREGVSRDGHALFPMMPYQAYRSMADEDARAIVAYLRTVPSVKNEIPPSRIAFPVNLLIKLAPQPLTAPVVAPSDASDHLGYGKYLVTIGGCADCHTPRDDKQQPIASRLLSGGWEMVGPWGRVVTANLTPDPETGATGRMTREQFVARFVAMRTVAEKPIPAAPGRNTVMPWIALSGMTEQDLGAIYDYLKSTPPIRNAVNSFPDAK